MRSVSLIIYQISVYVMFLTIDIVLLYPPFEILGLCFLIFQLRLPHKSFLTNRELLCVGVIGLLYPACIGMAFYKALIVKLCSSSAMIFILAIVIYTIFRGYIRSSEIKTIKINLAEEKTLKTAIENISDVERLLLQINRHAITMSRSECDVHVKMLDSWSAEWIDLKATYQNQILEITQHKNVLKSFCRTFLPRVRANFIVEQASFN